MESIRISDAQEESPEKFLNALAKNYLLQDAILNATELTIISTKPDGTITSINKAGEPMLGYSSLDLVGKAKLSVFNEPRELQKFQEELILTGMSVPTAGEALFTRAKHKIHDHREWIFRRKDGSHLPVMLSVTGIWNDQAELMGFLAIAEDISEQKQAETARFESDRKFKLMAENIQGTVYLCRNDETFSIVYLNAQVEQLTGYTVQEFFEGKINFVQLYHPDDKAMIFETVNKALELQEPFHLHYRFLHRSGEWKWMDEFGIGIYEGGQLKMREGYLIDITDRKKDEQELQLSKLNLEVAANELRSQNHQLNEFAHIISHNLRSPVGNIGALVSLLNEKSSLKDYQIIFEKLKAASGNLNETLNDLMEILLIKEDNNSDRTKISFEETLNKIKQGLSGEIIKSNTIITSDFSSCPDIKYSKTYLESILLNLLSNAIKYRSEERSLKVHFKTFHEDGNAVLTVSDNALGIDLKRFGNKIFHLRKTFHEHKDARGVGLFLTKTQIEAMGGSISVESEVGAGSVFTVRF